MLLLPIVLLASGPSPKAILDRYAAYRRANPTFSAKWSYQQGGVLQASGTILVDGERRLLFTAGYGTYHYSASETERGIVEMVPSEREYDEYRAQPGISLPPGKVSHGGQFIPPPLLSTAVYYPKIKYKSEGAFNVNGTVADKVSWIVTTMDGSVEYGIWVDRAGHVVRFTRGLPKGQTPRRPGIKVLPNSPLQFVTGWDITDYVARPNTSLSAFLTPVPKGYVPYQLPNSTALNLYVDETFPPAVWNDRGRLVDFRKSVRGTPALLLITAPGCIPSRRALANLTSIRRAVAGADVKVLSLATSAKDANGLAYDSTGAAGTAIGATSTPLFVLVDRSGKITNLWAGYDSASASSFVAELRAAVLADLKSRT